MSNLGKWDKEKAKEWKRKWRKANPDKVREIQRRYQQKHKEQIAKYMRKWRKKNRERLRIKAKEKARRLKFEVLFHYSHGKPQCACCGEWRIEFLTIHHINPDESPDIKQLGKGRDDFGRRRYGSDYLYRWLKSNNFPDGYGVLCFNCNCAKGFFGYCPHERETPQN